MDGFEQFLGFDLGLDLAGAFPGQVGERLPCTHRLQLLQRLDSGSRGGPRVGPPERALLASTRRLACYLIVSFRWLSSGACLTIVIL